MPRAIRAGVDLATVTDNAIPREDANENTEITADGAVPGRTLIAVEDVRHYADGLAERERKALSQTI
ncbi:hypothetical protein GCM10027416_19630 [Okibacterium endophyticum]